MEGAVRRKFAAYDRTWSTGFQELRRALLDLVDDVALSVEHVGSTAVPGLAAKPVIDVDVVVASDAEIPVVIARLAQLGYVHQGDLGIDRREAFISPRHMFAHHLYACAHDCWALQNHSAVRDYLRAHPAAVTEYAALKRRLAAEFPEDAAAYTKGKAGFILSILRSAKFPDEGLKAVERENLRPSNNRWKGP
ncbi:MAG: GrpB family protein [Gammaproteobacteria bacterium]|nr:MAG: GrpB family protein [Gammaproteobacteria bacterium]